MPRINATVSCSVHRSFHVAQITGMFDVPAAELSGESFSVEVPADDEEWSIGLIVGPSGSGKSTIARKAFGDCIYQPGRWPSDQAVVDGFGDLSTKKITSALTAVGFSSPPAWIRPYAVLSNGQKFRCDLARALLEDRPLVVFDEFTSVVDRTVAKLGSAAVSRAIRKGRLGKKFVAVSCHDDIAEWLAPDWIVDMATAELARGRLQRPPICLELFRCSRPAWRLFAPHHYLSAELHRSAQCYLAIWAGRAVAFCALLPLTGRAGRDRVSRIVVLPDYQGVGIGTRVLCAVGELRAAAGRRLGITTAHPSMIAALISSRNWRCTAVKKTGFSRNAKPRECGVNGQSAGRAVVSFEYVA